MKKVIQFILVFIFLFSCQTTKEDLSEYKVNGEFEKITDFIKKNYNDYRKKELLEYAINLIAKKKNEKHIKFLENIYFDNRTYTSSESDLIILRAFTKNNLKFKNYKNLCDNYCSSDRSDIILMENMIIKYQDVEVFDYCLNLLKYKIQHSQDHNDAFEKISSLIKSISYSYSSKKEINEWLKIKNDWIVYFSDSLNTIKKIDNLSGNTSDIEEEIAKIKIKIKDSNEYINEYKYFRLSGYIVGQHMQLGESIVYEIINNYNNKRCLLTTKETKFTSKGYFTLSVRKTGKMPVTTKGGFTPEWDVYVEVIKEEKEKLSNERSSIKKYKFELLSLKKKLKNDKKYKTELVGLKKKLKLVKNKKYDIVKLQKDLQYVQRKYGYAEEDERSSIKTNPIKHDYTNDIDGNVYKTVKIGSQVWMAENLKVTHYRNGDAIPNVISKSEWENLTTGAYCNYDNNSSNAAAYGGLLYNWYAVNDRRNIAPKGWRVPTDEEWQTLIDYLGGEAAASGKMKESSTAHWKSPNKGATNSSGFSALPGGYRYYNNGTFSNMGYFARYWSSTEYSSSNAWYRCLGYDGSAVSRGSSNKLDGFSVRCVRD